MTSSKKVGKIIILVGLLFGVLFANVGYSTYKKAVETENWPSVMGIVLESRVIEDTQDTDTSYQPYIKYSYVVDNKQYINTVIYPGDIINSGSYDSIKNFVDKYPERSQVPVYYNPNNPQDSVLIPGVSTGHIIILGIGIFFLVLSIILTVVIFLGIRFSNRNKEDNNTYDTVIPDRNVYYDNTENNMVTNTSDNNLPESDLIDNSNINTNGKYCPNCGFLNPNEAIFCTNCGNKI